MSSRFRSSTSLRGRYANESSDVEWCPTLPARISSECVGGEEGERAEEEKEKGRDIPVGHGLDEDRAALLDAAPARLLGGGVDGEDVVAVDADRVHTVARPAGRDAVAVVLLRRGRRYREAVVARDE